MYTYNKYIFILLLFFLSCSNQSDENYDSIKRSETLYNISYGNDPQQVFDIYLPKDRSVLKTKVLILVHGGGWISGDKYNMSYFFDYFKKNFKSYAIVNMNYRLAGNGIKAFPMQFEDIELVINKLKNSNYNISNNYGFVGASAGGHLSLQYSYTKNLHNEIKMVCSFVGPTNFTDEKFRNTPKLINKFKNVLGETYNENPNIYEQYSPIFHVNSNCVPTLLFYGIVDDVVPINQSISLKHKLDEFGVYNELYAYNGGHMGWSNIENNHAFLKMKKFIKSKF